jgi:hypothetical protein
MNKIFKDRRNWSVILMLVTILAISSVAVAQQGNQSIPGSASSGGTAANSPGIPTYNGPNIFYAANYATSGNGPLGKGIRMFDGAWTNVSKNITIGNNTNDTDPCITAAQIGWLIAGTNGASTTPNATATNEFGYPATITAVASCTSFTVSNTPTAACTSSVGNSLCQIVMAPYDDYPAVNAAWTAMVNALATGGTTSCGQAKLVLPQGLLWLSQPPRTSFKCNTDVSSNGSGTGYWVEGAGPYSTTLFPAPSGLWTVGVNQGTLFFNTGTAVGKGAHFANFTVDGAGQYASLGSSGFVFALNQNSSMSYVNIYTFGVPGINCLGGDAAEGIVDHVNAGGLPVGIQAGNYCKSSFSAYFWGTGAATGSAVFNGNPVWSTNDSFDFNSNTNGSNLAVTAGEAWVTSALVMSNSVNNPLINVTSGAKLHLSHSLVQNCLPGTNGVGLFVDSTPSFAYLTDTKITCTPAGSKALNIAGTLYDLGGNQYATTIANILTGTLIADGHSLKGACTGVGTAASTLGLYGTGANVVATTCTSVLIGTGVVTTGVRTLYNLKVTASAAGTNASSGVVTVLKNGAGTALTCTIGTGTSCSDGLHTVTTADGDLISIQFTTQLADTLAGVQALVEWQ